MQGRYAGEVGSNVATSVPTIEKALLQQQVDHLNRLNMNLDKILTEIDSALDRLVTRPPRPVDPQGSAPQDMARPSIEGALNLHGSYLEGLVNHASEVLMRLNRAV